MTSPSESLVVFPVIAVIAVGLFFIHLASRTKASLVAFITFSLTCLLNTFTALSDFATVFLIFLFVTSFFMSAASVPFSDQADRKKRRFELRLFTSTSDAGLMVTAIAFALSSAVSASLYWHLAAIGQMRVIGISLAYLAFITFVLFVLSAGLLIRRRANARLGA